MKTKRSLGFWQWETLLVTMGGYALYYIIRKNFSLAMPLLGGIGISKVQLGAFLTAGGMLYGVARFTNGILTDRNSARKVMSFGLFVCAMVNIVFGLSDFIALGGAAPAVAKGASAASALIWTMGLLYIIRPSGTSRTRSARAACSPSSAGGSSRTSMPGGSASSCPPGSRWPARRCSSSR